MINKEHFSLSKFLLNSNLEVFKCKSSSGSFTPRVKLNSNLEVFKYVIEIDSTSEGIY